MATDSAVTCTLSLSASTFITTSARAVCPTLTATRSATKSANPGLAIRSLYSPGFSVETRK